MVEKQVALTVRTKAAAALAGVPQPPHVHIGPKGVYAKGGIVGPARAHKCLNQRRANLLPHAAI